LIYTLKFEQARDQLYELTAEYNHRLKYLDTLILPLFNRAKIKRVIKSKEMKEKKIKFKVKDIYILNKEMKTGHLPSYHLRPDKRIELINNNPVLSINWAFYKDLLKNFGYKREIKKYQLRERCFDQNLLKELSTFMLVHGLKGDKNFHIFVGIEQLYGFNVASTMTDQTEKIRLWVNNKFKPTYKGSPTLYLDKFRDAVRKCLDWRTDIKVLEPDISLDQFCNNIPLTSTSGSAFDPGGPRQEIIIGDEQYKPGNSKFAKSAVLSPENKKKRILEHGIQKARVSVKVEVLPKSRIIVSSDYNMFLRMKFVDSWLSQWMAGNPRSTLWSTDIQKLEMWRGFAKQGNWNIPIDQSAFDHHVTKDMVQVINEEIKLLIRKKSAPGSPTTNDLTDTMDAIIYGMDHCQITYKKPIGVASDTEDTVSFNYESGVLSGWFWTAFYDTLANDAEKEIALDLIKQKGYDPGLLVFNAQGDDQLTKFKYLTFGVLYWLELSSAGFEIHPMKNFFSTTHNEYLRKYSTEEGINAYPARLVNKIVWLYPGKQDNYSPVEKLNNIYNRWSKIKERFKSNWKKVKHYMFADYRGAKVPRDIYETYLGAKNYNGGKDMPEVRSNDKIVETLPGSYNYHIEILGEGFRQFKKTFGEGQEREMDDWMIQALSIPDVIKGREIKTKSEVGFSEGVKVEPLPFVLFKNERKPSKPRLMDGWKVQDIFISNDEVMRKAFSDIDTYVEHSNAPKSWLYDYYTGRLTIPLPTNDCINAEGCALLFKEYENSLYLAMMRKGSRKERWKRLIVYIQEVILKEFKKDRMNPLYFNL